MHFVVCWLSIIDVFVPVVVFSIFENNHCFITLPTILLILLMAVHNVLLCFTPWYSFVELRSSRCSALVILFLLSRCRGHNRFVDSSVGSFCCVIRNRHFALPSFLLTSPIHIFHS